MKTQNALRVNVISFFDWLPTISTLPFQFENTLTTVNNHILHLENLNSLNGLRNMITLKDKAFHNITNDVDFLQVSYQSSKTRFNDNKQTITLNSTLLDNLKYDELLSRTKSLQYYQYWINESARILAEEFFMQKAGLINNNNSKNKLPESDLDYNIHSIFWWTHRGNYGLNWFYYMPYTYSEDTAYDIEQLDNFNQIAEGEIADIFEYGSALPYSSYNNVRWNDEVPTLFTPQPMDSNREIATNMNKGHYFQEFYVNVYTSLDDTALVNFDDEWDDEEFDTHEIDTMEFEYDYHGDKSVEYLFLERYLAETKFGNNFFHAIKYFDQIFSWESLMVVEDLYEEMFEEIPMHYFEDIGHKTVRILDFEDRWDIGMYYWLNKKYIQDLRDEFDKFEFVEGDYWFKEYRNSAFYWPWRNLRPPFTEVIHESNSKKLNKLKDLYNIWQLYDFTEWIIEDGDSMFVYEYFLEEAFPYQEEWDHELDLGDEEDHPTFWDDFDDSNLYIEEEEIKQSREEIEDFDYELSEIEYWSINLDKETHWDDEFEFVEYKRELLYAENDRGLIPNFFKSLDVQEDEFQLELPYNIQQKLLINFSDNLPMQYVNDDDELIVNHLNYHIEKVSALKELQVFTTFGLYLMHENGSNITENHIRLEHIETKPKKLFRHYYIHSFPDVDPAEFDNEDLWNVWNPHANFDYPNIGKTPLWKQLRQQKLSAINFWKLLRHHAFNLYDFNAYIHNKYTFIHLFHVLTLFVTNFDQISKKKDYDFFSLFFGFFKAKSNAYLGKSFLQYSLSKLPSKKFDIFDKDQADFDVDIQNPSIKDEFIDFPKAEKEIIVENNDYLTISSQWSVFNSNQYILSRIQRQGFNWNLYQTYNDTSLQKEGIWTNTDFFTDSNNEYDDDFFFQIYASYGFN